MKNLFRNIFLVSCLLLTVGAVEAQAQTAQQQTTNNTVQTQTTEQKSSTPLRQRVACDNCHSKRVVNRNNLPEQTVKHYKELLEDAKTSPEEKTRITNELLNTSQKTK